jgi:hypothetical protein
MHLINAPKALKPARSAIPNWLFPKSRVTGSKNTVNSFICNKSYSHQNPASASEGNQDFHQFSRAAGPQRQLIQSGAAGGGLTFDSARTFSTKASRLCHPEAEGPMHFSRLCPLKPKFLFSLVSLTVPGSFRFLTPDS